MKTSSEIPFFDRCDNKASLGCPFVEPDIMTDRFPHSLCLENSTFFFLTFIFRTLPLGRLYVAGLVYSRHPHSLQYISS